MRVDAHIEVNGPPSAIWPIIIDPEQLPMFMAGLTRWEATGQPLVGLGARYRVHMLVGSAHVGGLVEVVEFDDQRDIAWTSVTGVDHRGRWRLRERRPGCTDVTLRISYSAPGGFLAVLADRLAAPMLRRNLKRSLASLREMVEQRSVK